MRPLPLLLVLRLSLLVAIAASAALLVEYQNAGDPAFCGVESGCYAVRVSPYSSLFNVPLPVFGLLAYAGLLAASLVARVRDHHRFIALIAGVGGVAGVVLLALQHFVIGAICAWCLAVDLAAIVVAVVATLLAIQASKQPPSPAELSADKAALGGLKKTAGEEAAESASAPAPARLYPFWKITIAGGAETLIWGAAAALAIGLPMLWGRYPVIPPTPPAITALAVPGKLTIIGFTDFQCPFCRKLHPWIHDLERAHGDRLHYARHMMPLPSHPGAMPAAQAYLCAPEGKRDAAADWLYTVPVEALTRAGVLAMADAIGVPRAEFAQCMASPATQAAIARDKEIYDTLGARGLPLTVVGTRVVIGYNPDRIERAVESELQGQSLSLKLSWLFAVLGLLFAGTVLFTWRTKTRVEAETSAS